MGPEFLADFMGGGKLPGFSSSSSATALGGTQITPWNEGDIVVSYDKGDARSGDRTAPAPIATTPGGAVVGAASASNISSGAVLAAVAIVGAGLAWRVMHK